MKNSEVRTLDVSGWPLPDELLIELGRLTTLWASLESLIDFSLAKLAGFHHEDPKPFILVKHSSMPQKLDMLGALCEQLAIDYANLSGYRSVLGKIRSAQRDRNRFLHNAMAVRPDTGNVEMPVGSARGKLKAEVVEVRVVDIRRAWIKIHEAQLALYKLVLGREIDPVWVSRRKNR